MPYDFTAHLTRQAAFSRAMFGPGPRTEGVLDHIRKEMAEVRDAVASGDLCHAVEEWVDLCILSLDGLLRAVREHEESVRPDQRINHDMVALIAAQRIIDKQGKNELREWPDWRTADPEKAITHERFLHED
jgi:hypothetical protein